MSFINHYFDEEIDTSLHELNFMCDCNPDLVITSDKCVAIFHKQIGDIKKTTINDSIN